MTMRGVLLILLTIFLLNFASAQLQATGSNWERECQDGVCQTTLYSYEKYWHNGNDWEEIDESFFDCSDENGEKYCTKSYYFDVVVQDNGLISASREDGALSFSLFNLLDMELSFDSPKVEGSVITYENIAPNIDLRYQYFPRKLKEDIIINQRLENLPKEDFEIIFTKSGDANFDFLDSTICDSNETCQILNQKIQEDQISIEIPVDFLNDPEIQYPVYIDPTIILNHSDKGWDGRIKNVTNIITGVSAYSRQNNPNFALHIGGVISTSANEEEIRRADIDWNISAIPDLASIEALNLSLYIFGDSAGNSISSTELNIREMEGNVLTYPNTDGNCEGNCNFYLDMKNGTIYNQTTLSGKKYFVNLDLSQEALDDFTNGLGGDTFSTGLDSDYTNGVQIISKDNSNSERRPKLIVTHSYKNYSLTYDANGNLIEGFDKKLMYNSFNKLVQVNDSSDNIIAVYSYDNGGNRIKKIEYDIDAEGNNKTTYYPFKEFVQERITNGTTLNYVYYYANGNLLASKQPDGSMLYYHPDHLGSTTLVTNETGDVVEDDVYLPFGGSYSGEEDSRYLYTGQEKDKDTGFYYYGARYYDSEFRHFLQADPMIADIYNPQNLNRYSYVLNNPYKYVDPNGKWAVQVGVQGQVGAENLMFIGEIGLYYTRSNSGGDNYGFYQATGAGISLIPNVEGDVSGSLIFSPYAQGPDDLKGESTNIGGSILVGEGIGVAIGAGIGLDSSNKDRPSSYDINVGAGGKAIQAQGSITSTSTETISIKDAMYGAINKFKESLTDLVMQEKENRQSINHKESSKSKKRYDKNYQNSFDRSFISKQSWVKK